MTKRAATLYRRSGRFLASSMSQTVDGFWIASPPFLDLGTEPTESDLGEMVAGLLRCSKEGVENPRREHDTFAPIARLAGVKTFSAFMSGAESIDLYQEWDRVIVTPMRNDGARAGFAFIEQRREELEHPSTYRLGEAVLAAFERTEGNGEAPASGHP